MIFGLLKKYADERLGRAAWRDLLKESGLAEKIFLSVESYPDADLVTLVGSLARRSGQPVATVLEDFGRSMTVDLMKMYGSMARPEWRSLEFLENVEQTIHRVVRLRHPGAAPPAIKTERHGPDAVIIHYRSSRRLCALARGLIAGVARHYGEEVQISEPSCMLRAAPGCEIVVRRT